MTEQKRVHFFPAKRSGRGRAAPRGLPGARGRQANLLRPPRGGGGGRAGRGAAGSEQLRRGQAFRAVARQAREEHRVSGVVGGGGGVGGGPSVIIVVENAQARGAGALQASHARVKGAN